MNGKVIIAEEYLDPVEELSDAQAGKLMKAVMRYSVTGELPETEDQAVTILFMLMKSYIDRNKKAYEETCRRNRENGKLGGRPKTERLSEKPSGYSENPKNPIQNQNQNHIQIQNQRGGRFAPPTLEEIRDYVHEAGLQMDPQRFFDYFTSNGWKVSGRAPMKDWKAAARNWAAREKAYRPENKKDERRIDYDAAIRDLYIREVSGG